MERVFVITGTSSGIGRDLTLYYLNYGKVYGCSRKESSVVHDNYTHFQLDVSDEDAVINMIDSIPKVDVLINNAGVASMNYFITTPYSTVKKIFETNFYGSFLFSREVLKKMIQVKKGRIINFSTVAVPLNLGGELVYASSKSAIEQMTRILAKEAGNFGITVNTVAPSATRTNLTKSVPDQKINSIIDRQSVKIMVSSNDIINVTDFFINERSDLITGQTIYLGGAY